MTTATAIDDELDIDLSGLTIDEDIPVRTRRPRSDAGKTRKPRTPRTGPLIEKLLIPWATLTTLASGPLPMTASIMAMRGEPTISALVQMAHGHPKMMAALERVGKVGPASELVQTGTLLLLAIAVETGRLPVDHPISVRSGMADLYQQTHPDTADIGNTSFQPPPGMTYAG